MPKVVFKQTTAGHYGLRWFVTEGEAKEFSRSSGHLNIPMYWGLWDKMPDSVARKLATIHPNFKAYYADAMMPLWALYGEKVKYGSSENGSESMQIALAWQIKDTHPFVVIWNILEEDEDA